MIEGCLRLQETGRHLEGNREASPLGEDETGKHLEAGEPGNGEIDVNIGLPAEKTFRNQRWIDV